MDVFTLVQACLRRWYVFVPLLAITAVVSVVQARGVTPDYSANASLTTVAATVKVNSKTGFAVTNPLNSSGTLQNALVARLNSATSVEAVAAKTGGGFGAGVAQSGIFSITASAPSERATLATLNAAVAQASVALRSLERDVNAPRSTYARVVALSVDPSAATSYPHRSRNIVLIAIVGLVISMLIVQLLDVALLARRRRRLSSGSPVPDQQSVQSATQPDLF